MKTQPQINGTISIEPCDAEKMRRQLIEQLKMLAKADGKSVTVNYYPLKTGKESVYGRIIK